MWIDEYCTRGWIRFPFDRELLEWVARTLPIARGAVTAPENAIWHVCEGTWFVGVNALPNKSDGSVEKGIPLRGMAVETVAELGFPIDRWDRAQISVIYPGYPRSREGESEAAFAYRRDRDAAHVDGLVRVGPDRKRMLREPHAFILGIPLTEAGSGASPVVVWEGSHEIMRRALGEILCSTPVEDWPEADLTEIYHAARHEAFRRCRRVPVCARPDEGYLIHRLALHGVAPWEQGAEASDDGRMIAYFRPLLDGPMSDWIHKA